MREIVSPVGSRQIWWEVTLVMRFDETLAALSSLVVEQVSCAVLWDWVMPHELDTLLH